MPPTKYWEIVADKLNAAGLVAGLLQRGHAAWPALGCRCSQGRRPTPHCLALDFMLRLLKVVLALAVPAIVVFVLTHSGLRNMSTVSLAEWFTGYLIAIAAPQLVLIWVGTIRSFHTWAVVGALVALDTWLIFSRGRFSIRRITLEPVGLSIWSGHCRSAAAGALLGKAASSLTRRWS